MTPLHMIFGQTLVRSSSMNQTGLITSRCLGGQPAFLPKTHSWTHGLGIVISDQ